MKIEKAAEKDFQEIIILIKQEFPYVERDIGKLGKRIAEGNIVIFKAAEGSKILGFIEVEFLEANIARVNGLSVKESARRMGVGKTLLAFAIEELKKKGIARILLLVKQENKEAKAIYERMGFSFIGLYHRAIDNAVVEEMELDLTQESPDYVS